MKKGGVSEPRSGTGGVNTVSQRAMAVSQSVNKGGWKIRIDKVINMPLTFEGTAVFMIQNILPAALTAFLRNVKIEELRLALQTFIPSPAQTPGRMNLFDFQNFKVLLDFAHNPAGMEAVGMYLNNIEDSPKIGIIAGTGDRRDEDIVEFGEGTAKYFDEIVVRQDKHMRGRTAEEIVELLIQGIKNIKPDMPIQVIYDEREAIEATFKRAPHGSFICILAETVPDGLDIVADLKEKEGKLKIRKQDIPNLN